MIEKILNFNELKLRDINFTNKEFEKITKDLKKIGFFSEEKGEKDISCGKVFSILRKNSDYNDVINGRAYIKEVYFEDEKPIKAKIYDFDLHVISTCS